ncbi:MAG: OB-fold nucleic acid binding domain-containing protein [Planctomycetia bacterium]|nr:OB-fold nucleic acid binding domain-containing protein [Planctomycetia bacterium]
MVRHFINEFQDQESINQVFRAGNKLLRPNRNGETYLQVDLSDKTGSLTARLWNAGESVYNSFENGDYIQVEGKTQIFQGAMQMIAKKIRRVEASNVDEDDFLRIPSVKSDQLVVKMSEMLRNLRDPNLNALAECYLMDADFMQKFCVLPAGVKHHHAYFGGLIQHTLTMMEAAQKLSALYPKLHPELLIFSAFLHDTGKTEELASDPEFSYTDEGQLLGHIALGLRILDAKIVEAERLSGETFPPEVAKHLRHIIASHHGEYEYGSPKLPMTLEAMALHCLDMLDSKLAAFDQVINEDLNSSSPWTLFVPTLQRKLYKKEL